MSNPFTPLPDLVQRDVAPLEPDQLWVTGLTHVRTGEGWLHLAVVHDDFSSRPRATSVPRRSRLAAVPVMAA